MHFPFSRSLPTLPHPGVGVGADGGLGGVGGARKIPHSISLEVGFAEGKGWIALDMIHDGGKISG